MLQEGEGLAALRKVYNPVHGKMMAMAHKTTAGVLGAGVVPFPIPRGTNPLPCTCRKVREPDARCTTPAGSLVPWTHGMMHDAYTYAP